MVGGKGILKLLSPFNNQINKKIIKLKGQRKSSAF